jgi:hypothetical protein
MRGLSLILVWLLALPLARPAAAQEAAPKLNLVVIEGEGAVNNVRQRTAREPIVQVQDENHKPVAGAIVVFSLSARGAGGQFANGSQTLTVTSDSQGNAVARGFQPHGQGQFQIHVNASFNGQTASTDIHMSNGAAAATTAAASGISTKLLIVLAVVGAAAAGGGAYYATHNGNSNTTTSTSSSSITITAGTGTVGPPH